MYASYHRKRLLALRMWVLLCSGNGWHAVAARSVAAEEEKEPAIFTFTIENDAVADTDKHYTNGVRFSYLHEENSEPVWLRQLAERWTGLREGESHRFEYALGQHIYTPEDTESTEFIADDRPYAGWLYTSLGLAISRKKAFDQFEINVGVIGPLSFAEQTQNTIHRWTSSGVAQGWDHQISNEPTLQLSFQRNWWVFRNEEFAGLRWDVIPHAGFTVGNAVDAGNVGITLAMGSGSIGSYGLPRIGFPKPGCGYFRAGKGWSWKIYTTAEGGFIGHNIFLDDSLFRNSDFSLGRDKWGEEIHAGFVVTIRRFKLSYTHIWRSKEFKSQSKGETYGALSLSYAL